MEFIANPHALLTDGVVTDVVYMQDYSKEEIDTVLLNYSYDEIVVLSEYGRTISVGYTKIGDDYYPPKPYPSWIATKDVDPIVGNYWLPPVIISLEKRNKAPEGYDYFWDEETVNWVLMETESNPNDHDHDHWHF